MKHALTSLILCMIASHALTIRAQEPADAQEDRFPRCDLSDADQATFFDIFARSQLSIAEGSFDVALEYAEEAFTLCPDDELLWLLARLHERLDHPAQSARFDELWVAQRELNERSTTPLPKPSWLSDGTTEDTSSTAAISLDVSTKAKRSLGTYAIELPQVYRPLTPVDPVSPARAGAFQFARDLARLSVHVTPASVPVTLWLADGTQLGEAPLDELMIPADTELVLLIKSEGRPTVTRTIQAEARTHQRLYVELP